MKPAAISTLRGVLATLSRETPDLEHPERPLSEQEALETGWLLWRIGQLVQRAQEPAKSTLRDLALIYSKGEPGPVEFQGPGRVGCIVVIQKPTMRLRKDAPTVFQGFAPLIEQGAQVDDFGLNPEAKGRLLEHIDIDTPPPRVSFSERSTRK